jgi:prepilin-type N-terminal cleavage/methylation domain-containing protein
MMRSKSPDQQRPPAAMTRTLRERRGFTLIELLVSMALLIVLMVSISEVFTISSDSATRIAADAEVLAASASFRETISDQVSKMTDGLLVIDCPAPTEPRAEIREGSRFLRLRHDRLVFMTHGDIGEYQSFTDPTRGDPTNVDRQTAGSAEALVYFGPGIPLTRRSMPAQNILSGLDDPVLTASEWVFLHRSILLMLETNADTEPSWTPPDMDVLATMLSGGSLDPGFLDGTMDAVISDTTRRANAQTIAGIILRKPFSDLLSATPSIAALWEPSLAPRSVTVANAASLDYYTRGGSNFIPRLADLRIEWTDGRRIDPLGPDGIAGSGDEDTRTRWFGLRPDPQFDVSNAVLNNIATTQIPNVAVRRQDVASYGGGRFADSTQEEVDAFRDRIEWDTATGSAPNTAYRAIWRGDTWQYRPKALRFTYRIYDGGNRLKQGVEVDLDEDGDPDPDGTGASRLFTRFGRRFSVVVMLP